MKYIQQWNANAAKQGSNSLRSVQQDKHDQGA